MERCSIYSLNCNTDCFTARLYLLVFHVVDGGRIVKSITVILFKLNPTFVPLYPTMKLSWSGLCLHVPKYVVFWWPQVRTTGPIDILTHQPVKGRKRAGGIRFGEMERDSLLAHGTSFLLQDRLLNCSDRSFVSSPRSSIVYELDML